MIRLVPYAVVAILLVSRASCQKLVSPCPNIFEYEPNIDEDYAKRWYGIITLLSSETLYGVSVDVVLTIKADSLGNWYGRVTSRDNTEYNIQNSRYVLEPGKQLQIRFYTQYRDASNVPLVRMIRLNGREICSNGERPSAPQPPPPPPPVSATPVVEGTGLSPPAGPTVSRTRTTDKTAWIRQCYSHDKVNPLVTAGKRTRPGDWPWHVAIYHNEMTSSIQYKCGGSLISDKHVLTAAHCLINRQTSSPIDIRSVTVYLGTHNLRTFSEGIQFRLVDGIEIHGDYNSQTQYKDIALIRLNQPAVFTSSVRPVCLWPEDKVDLSNVAGSNGSVVGWGYDENGQLTDELMLAELPVVPQTTCLWSHVFYQRYTNEFTFCAGLLQGTSVCNGDSGGGMVFKLRSGTDTEEWFLRGIVSFSPAAGNTRLCDPSRYVIFTDIAKYLSWIKDLVTRDM